jgi:F-type H+-transporting ATPase subunit b
MENELLSQLGINWKLFLSQAVNFFILLIVLKVFVYKPILNIIKERSKKIKEGLDKAEEADVRLKEVDIIAKGKIKEAEQESINIIKNTEEKAKVLAGNLQKKTEERQKELQEQVKQSFEKQSQEANELVYKEAVFLVKKMVIKTTELNPDQIDEALIRKAAVQIKESSI